MDSSLRLIDRNTKDRNTNTDPKDTSAEYMPDTDSAGVPVREEAEDLIDRPSLLYLQTPIRFKHTRF